MRAGVSKLGERRGENKRGRRVDYFIERAAPKKWRKSTLILSAVI